MDPSPGDSLSDASWRRLLRRQGSDAIEWPLYRPLLEPVASADGSFVLARLAQSLDGRIAAQSGNSFWISGDADILHTHRLRALVDAVVVGAGTVAADDPQLTTRACAGPSPVRVVLDTNRRLPAARRLFGDGPATLLFCADDATESERPGEAQVERLPRAAGGGLHIPAVLAALRARGLRRLLVEGGGVTISRFLTAGAVDRLHVTIAPLLLGSGVPAFTFAGAQRPSDGLRLTWSHYRLGQDLLLDIPLNRARPAAGS